MDRHQWLTRFVAGMEKLGADLPSARLVELSHDAYALGSHMAPETVARIESDYVVQLRRRPYEQPSGVLDFPPAPLAPTRWSGAADQGAARLKGH